MNSLGYHYLIELYGCNEDILKDKNKIESIFSRVIEQTGATEIGRLFHKFSPHGISGVILISESHYSIHTWPEKHYAAVDLFTCDETMDIKRGYELLKKEFKARYSSITEIKRGLDLSY